MADMAQAIGRDADAARYTTLHGKIVAAAQKELLKPNGIARNASQTSQVLALHCGLTPPDQRAAAADVPAADILRRGLKLPTGLPAPPYLTDALADSGRVGMSSALWGGSV